MAIKKSNRGASIDMDALISGANPGSPAVGNMRVNANGDRIGPNGEIVQNSEDRVRDYYKDNPKSSTSTASLKGKKPGELEPRKKVQPDVDSEPTGPVLVEEPDEFDTPEEATPLGYTEVELDNGDIQMVPYYKEEDK